MPKAITLGYMVDIDWLIQALDKDNGEKLTAQQLTDYAKWIFQLHDEELDVLEQELLKRLEGQPNANSG